MKDNLSVLGLDLSQRRPGMAFVDFYENFVAFGSQAFPAFEKDFASIYFRFSEVLRVLKHFASGLEPSVVAIETALPKGQWAAGGFGLVSLALSWIEEEFDSAIVLFHPTFLGHLHRARSYPKSDSVKLAKMIVQMENLPGNTKRLNHDEAEAFIMAYGGACTMGHEPVVCQDQFKGGKGVVYRNFPW